MIPMFLDDDAGVYLHTENGLLGVGPRPDEDELDSDMIDAAKRPVTALPGRVVLRQRRELRDDPGRPHRRRRARRAPGQRRRGHRQLGGARQGRARRRRRDGSRRRRRPRDRDDDGDLLARRAQGGAGVHLSADREGRGRRRHHGALRLPRARRVRSSWSSSSSGATTEDVKAATAAEFSVDLEVTHAG